MTPEDQSLGKNDQATMLLLHLSSIYEAGKYNNSPPGSGHGVFQMIKRRNIPAQNGYNNQQASAHPNRK